MRFEIAFFVSLVIATNCIRTNENDEVLELIAHEGYRGEAHKVETEDGYILKLHRIIPRNPNGKQPILIMHGIAAASSDFVVTGKNVGLGYLLSDYGYDVWMGNSRGGKHSFSHRLHSPDSPDYWRFSWHEMGYYDIATMIDYILCQTWSPNLYYIGHSQGTTSLLVLLSTKPEYNRKILQAHLMAPPAFREKLPKSLLVLFVLGFLDRHEEIRFLDLRRLFRLGQFITDIICRDNDLFVFRYCKKLIGRGFGGNSSKEVEIETKLLPKLIKYLSPRVSVMQLTHYYQNMVTNRFRQFDHKDKNFMYYNSSMPPDYELSNVIVPVYIYHAAFDNFITEKGAAHLRRLLPNVREYRILSNWNHIDFVYSKNSRKILYYDILKSIFYNQ